MKFIGQKGQDEWVIDTIFNYKTGGYFVDLVATDGVAINNTLLLESELNWDGICIEPNPKYYDKLKKNRNCNVTDVVVDKVPFIKTSIPAQLQYPVTEKTFPLLLCHFLS